LDKPENPGHIVQSENFDRLELGDVDNAFQSTTKVSQEFSREEDVEELLVHEEDVEEMHNLAVVTETTLNREIDAHEQVLEIEEPIHEIDADIEDNETVMEIEEPIHEIDADIEDHETVMETEEPSHDIDELEIIDGRIKQGAVEAEDLEPTHHAMLESELTTLERVDEVYNSEAEDVVEAEDLELTHHAMPESEFATLERVDEVYDPEAEDDIIVVETDKTSLNEVNELETADEIMLEPEMVSLEALEPEVEDDIKVVQTDKTSLNEGNELEMVDEIMLEPQMVSLEALEEGDELEIADEMVLEPEVVLGSQEPPILSSEPLEVGEELKPADESLLEPEVDSLASDKQMPHEVDKEPVNKILAEETSEEESKDLSQTSKNDDGAAQILQKQADAQAQALRQALGNVEDPAIAKSLKQALFSLGALDANEAAEFDSTSAREFETAEKSSVAANELIVTSDEAEKQISDVPIINIQLDGQEPIEITNSEETDVNAEETASELQTEENSDHDPENDSKEEKTFFSKFFSSY